MNCQNFKCLTRPSRATWYTLALVPRANPYHAPVGGVRLLEQMSDCITAKDD